MDVPYEIWKLVYVRTIANVVTYKSGPASDPSSFHPITLTSTIGKLFNRILASRFEKFIRGNGIVDPSIQKGFLSGIQVPWNASLLPQLF